MKTIKILAVVVWMAMGGSAFAQSSEMFPYGKNNIYVSYDFGKLKGTSDSDVSENDSKSISGATIGYSRLFGISQKVPVFVEVGASLRYIGLEEEYLEEGLSFSNDHSISTLKVPVSIGYQFAIGNKGFSIAPYAGLNLQYHIKAETKVEATDEDGTEKNTYDWFDADGSHRFQAGWQVGAHVAYRHFVVGVSYGNTFNKIIDKKEGSLNLNVTSISLGYRF